MNTNNTATWLKHCIDCGEIRITTESWSINHMKNSKREQRLHKGLYRLQCVLLYHQYSTRLGNTGNRAFPITAARTWNSLPLEVTSSRTLSSLKFQLKPYLFSYSAIQPNNN